jgi:medium-chain acyl-[acyl-carrier-protein] hydrolase
MYREWARDLPPEIEVCAVCLPGRESLFTMPLRNELFDIAQHVTGAIEPYLDLPHAFFGHSMGAVVAFEVGHALRAARKTGPNRLIVSARRAPDLPDRFPPMRHLPDAELVREVNRRYGGIPQQVLENDELLQLFVPVMRADLTALGTYRYVQRPPLDCAISCFSGAADAWVAAGELEHWRTHTSADFEAQILPGAHFYLFNEGKAALLGALVRTLSGSGTLLSA